VYVVHNERQMQKTPRWWSVSPPTPPEAPEAKRRTAARSRGSLVVMLAASIAFVVFALLMLFRVGRQVGAAEPAAGVLVSASPVVWPFASAGAPATPEAGVPSRPAPGASTGRNRRPPEVIRKPGF
jgi:hypothetical protein